MSGKKVDDCFYKVILDDGIETSIFNKYIDHEEHPTIRIFIKGKLKKVRVYSGTRKLYDAITKYVDRKSGFITISKSDLMASSGLLDFQIDRALGELVKNKIWLRCYSEETQAILRTLESMSLTIIQRLLQYSRSDHYSINATEVPKNLRLHLRHS